MTQTPIRKITRSRLRKPLALLGPAFVASIAYVDPGNFATNIAAGAEHGYQLVWVILMANMMAMLVQYLSSKVGLATGASLPELCRSRFGSRTNVFLWIQAEIVAMATDLAEIVGAAVGINLVFGLPLFGAGLISAIIAFVILAVQQRGYRPFELVIICFLLCIAAGFVYLFFSVGGQRYPDLIAGVVPSVGSGSSLTLTVGIIGATVMPHVVYLHSALYKNRKTSGFDRDRRSILKYDRIDCFTALGIAGVVNLSMLCIAAALFSGRASIPSTFESIHQELTTLVGGGAALAFGLALMASGLSSTSVGTYSGQVIMDGFMRWRLPMMLRRGVTMIPALLVLALSADVAHTLVYSQILLSFGIPFALIPLLIVTRDRAVMRDMVNRPGTSAAMSLVTLIIIVLNVYLIYSTVVDVI